MCGIVLASSDCGIPTFHKMVDGLAHRGSSPPVFLTYGNLWMAFHRLPIVDVQADYARQPFRSKYGITMFNGEIYNRKELFSQMIADDHRVQPDYYSEVSVIDALMQRVPYNFQRFLDGYFGIVRVDTGRDRIVIARDMIGVIPLYYQRRPFAVASESKVLQKPIEVMPGETLTFNMSGKLLKRNVFDPISLHMEPLDITHLFHLFLRAVSRRYLHSERPVTVAMSGGLDSALVLAALHFKNVHDNVTAITVGFEEESIEVSNAKRYCAKLGVKHKFVKLRPQELEQDREWILHYLEDPKHNPIKYAAMIRNYYVAKYAPGTVILCGEGADELGCGYPSHLRVRGLELEWKSYSTLRSMHAINLDRVNKGGMAWTKEYRTPFLDRALVQYVMGCRKEPGKHYFRELARMLQVPDYILTKEKYSDEERRLWDTVSEWKIPA